MGLLSSGEVLLDVDDLNGGFSFRLNGSDHNCLALDVFSSKVEFGSLSGVGILDFSDFGDSHFLAYLGLYLGEQFLDLSFVVISYWNHIDNWSRGSGDLDFLGNANLISYHSLFGDFIFNYSDLFVGLTSCVLNHCDVLDGTVA